MDNGCNQSAWSWDLQIVSSFLEHSTKLLIRWNVKSSTLEEVDSGPGVVMDFSQMHNMLVISQTDLESADQSSLTFVVFTFLWTMSNVLRSVQNILCPLFKVHHSDGLYISASEADLPSIRPAFICHPPHWGFLTLDFGLSDHSTLNCQIQPPWFGPFSNFEQTTLKPRSLSDYKWSNWKFPQGSGQWWGKS